MKVLAIRDGVDLRQPSDWTLEVAEEGVWQFSVKGGAAFVQTSDDALVLCEASLDDCRQDLRLLAARAGGDLISCDIIEEIGVFGLTKRPRPRTPTGVTYMGHGLLPAAVGHATVIVCCHEGEPTGLRETALFLKLERDEGLKEADWEEAAYDFTYPKKPGLASRFLKRERPNPFWNSRVRRNKGDDPRFDEVMPDHALSLVRQHISTLLDHVTTSGLTPSTPRAVHHHGCAHEVPPGFHDFHEMPQGQVFVRQTFDGEAEFLSVCAHQDFPDSGKSLKAARAMFKEHQAMSGMQIVWGPNVESASISDRPGFVTRYDAVLNGREITGASYYTPWEDHSLELTWFGQRGDQDRGERRVRRLIDTLGEE